MFIMYSAVIHKNRIYLTILTFQYLIQYLLTPGPRRLSRSPCPFGDFDEKRLFMLVSVLGGTEITSW